jgi:hypothetical protein
MRRRTAAPAPRNQASDAPAEERAAREPQETDLSSFFVLRFSFHEACGSRRNPATEDSQSADKSLIT